MSDTDATRCPVCGTPAQLREGTLGCDACGTQLGVRGDGLYSARGAPAAVHYPRDGAERTAQLEDESYWFHHRNQVLLWLLRKHGVRAPLWDVGGGNGFQARCFQQCGLATVLVEPGAEACARARQRGVETVIAATLDALHLPAASVAAITLLDVLEHLEDPAALLGEVRRVLRPDGLIMITVPAHPWLWSHEDVYAQHLRRYTWAGLAAQLASSGFTVRDQGYFFSPLLLPILLLRTLPSLLQPHRAKDYVMQADDHRPGGVSQRLLTRWLASELRALERGARVALGSSLYAVAGN